MLLSAVPLLLLAALSYAQPQDVPPRATRAISLVGNDIYLYGGSGPGGDCYSDFYSLHLDPMNGWPAGAAPWNNVKQGDSRSAPVLGVNSWAVPSTEGTSLLFYGQTLCPQQVDKGSTGGHKFSSTSASIQYQLRDNSWSPSGTENDVLGPRLVKNDESVPVQVIDARNHMAYTFVYDAYNPQLGVQLWSFSTEHLPTNVAKSAKNTTMLTTRPSTPPPPPPPLPPVNGTNLTVPVPAPPPAPAPVVLAPYVDVGSAVYINNSIVVIGGGRTTGQNLTSDDVDPTSGWHKMDRCWVYTIATNKWSVRTLTAAGGKFPLPRRLAALLVVGTKIYMHGGNTTQTVPTNSYASDLWILDTQTWQWTSGPSSSYGRASHTLIHFQDSLLTLSGFEFETTKTKAAQNAYVMVYDLNTTTWGSQFGVVNKTFFQKHGAALIGVSIACFVLVLVIASIMARLWRRYTRGPLPSRPSAAIGGLSRKRLNKTSLASKKRSRAGSVTNHSPPDRSPAHAAASRLPDMTIANQQPKSSESKMPRTSESTVYDLQQLGQQQNRHQSFNPYAPMHQQQQVPLMSANALERPSQDFGTYRDDDEPEEKDMRPTVHHSYSGNGDSRSGSFGYVGQPAVLPVVPSREQTPSGTTVPGPRNQSPSRG